MRYPWQSKWKPVSVLTGFLGSGKTTLLKHLLSLPEMKGTALIINEFGEVAVDHLLVENAEEKMVLLANGCVCCTVRGDLVKGVKSLFERQKADDIPPFQRILLETTGLADPGPIVQSLIGPALAHFPVYFDSITTTVDSTNAIEAIQEHSQLLPQIAVADSLVLTKSDMSSPERMAEVQVMVEKINPRARIQQTCQGQVPATTVFGQRLLDPSASPRQMREQTQQMFGNMAMGNHPVAPDILSFVITREEPLTYATLDTFLKSLRGYRGEDLLRVKGLAKIQGSEKRPFVIHGVQSVMHPPAKLKRWPTTDQRTQLVFITRNISQEDVENMLQGIEKGFR